MVTTVKPTENKEPMIPSQSEQACQLKWKKKGRCFKKMCCCLGFLLIINFFIMMHIGHMVGIFTWFAMNGSVTYHDTTYTLVPGGAQSFCNDLCVDLCIFKDVKCELKSCLNVCNENMVELGNDDDFEPYPEPMKIVIDFIDIDDQQFIDEAQVIDEPFMSTQQGDDDDEQDMDVLKKMQHEIVQNAQIIRSLKEGYSNLCAANPKAPQCLVNKDNIIKQISMLKMAMASYDQLATKFNIDIRAEVWLKDIDQLTAEP